MKRGSLEQRFWKYVNKNGPLPKTRIDLGNCWIWTNYVTQDGYGQISDNGMLRRVHRVSLELSGVIIPPEFEVDHLCRNRACVNPRHLEIVTHRTNTLRGIGITAVNALKQFCKNGHSLSKGNIYIRPSHPNFRDCAICKRNRDRINLRNWRAARRRAQ